MDWLAKYVEWSSVVCESPLIFHRWVGLWLASNAIQRRVWVPLHGEPIYCNLYIMLVGPSGRVQKSTVADHGVKLLDNLDVVVMQDRVTRAYLSSYLSEASARLGASCISIYAPELRTALNEMTIAEGIMEILTRAYDCPRKLEYRLKSGGVLSATDVWVSLLACSTPQWLTVGMSRDEVGGGFAGRIVMLYGDVPHQRLPYSPTLRQTGQSARAVVVNRLLAMQKLTGEMTVTEAAGRIWDKFREENDRTILEKDARVQPFCDRLHIHVLKVAALRSLTQRDDMTIDADDMLFAIAMLEEAEDHIIPCLQSVSPSKAVALGDVVLDIMRKMGGMATRTDLMRKLYGRRLALSVQEFNEIVEMLEASDLIISVTQQSRPGAKLSTIYYVKECAPQRVRETAALEREWREYVRQQVGGVNEMDEEDR